MMILYIMRKITKYTSGNHLKQIIPKMTFREL